MTLEDIKRVQQNFVDAARRALEAGFEWIELHFAHGYLAQSFFSEHSNQRTDAYGGSLENRSRFLVETLAAVRKVWPEHLPLTVRFGVIEFDGRDEQTFAESMELVKRFKTEGLDLLSVSIGFTIPEVNIPWGPGFMAPIAGRVREEVGLPVTSAWGLKCLLWQSRPLRNTGWILSQLGAPFLLIRTGPTQPQRPCARIDPPGFCLLLMPVGLNAIVLASSEVPDVI